MLVRQSILLLLLFCLACADSRETRVQRFLLKGNDMVKKQNYTEAKRYFMEAIRLDSCFSDGWNNLGTVHFRELHFQEALEAYDRAIECNPSFNILYLNRANTLYELNRYNDVLLDVRRYESAEGDSVVTLFLKGLAHTGLRNFDSAKYFFRNALEMDSRNDEILINLANVFYYDHEVDSARAILAEAEEISPGNPNVLNTLALLEAEEGNIAKAMDLIDRAIRKDESNAYFLNNRGYFYLLLGELAAGLADINRSIVKDPKNPWAYRNKGLYYLKVGDFDSALRLLSRAEEIDANIDQLSRYLAEAWLGQGNKSRACEYFVEAERRGEITLDQYNRYCR